MTEKRYSNWNMGETFDRDEIQIPEMNSNLIVEKSPKKIEEKIIS